MNKRKMAGKLIVLGFALFVIGAILSPRGIYEQPDIDTRVEIVNANQLRWVSSQALSGLAMVIIAAAFLLFTQHLKSAHPAWMLNLGAGGMILGALFGIVYLLQFTPDPGSVWSYPGTVASVSAAVVSTLIGFLMYALVFRRGAYPPWLRYLSLGAVALAAAIFLAGGGSVAFYAVAVIYLAAFAASFVLRRSR